MLTAVIHHSTVKSHTHTYINTTRPNRSVTPVFCPQVGAPTSSLFNVQLDTQLLSPSGRPMTSLAGGFELQSILGNTKCAKPISTPPCAGHTRSQSEYTEPSDVNNRSGVGETPFRFLSSLLLFCSLTLSDDIRQIRK